MRAYAYIDRAKARVGNAALDRCWSALMGTTISLIDRPQRFDWLSGRADEFRLTCDGRWLTAMDFADTEWSERVDDAGATLVCRQAGHGVEVLIETLAWHDAPAMRRRVTLANRGDRPLSLGPVEADHVTLRACDLSLEVRRLVVPGGVVTLHPAVATGAARGRALVFAAAGETTLEVRSNSCAAMLDAPRLIPPLRQWILPDLFTWACDDSFSLAEQNAFTEFLRRDATRTADREPEND
jgi:hypothetical protein